MSGVFTVDPRGMKASQWAAASTINLDRFGSVPAMHNDGDWRSWGASVSTLGALSGINVPNPYDFSAFEEWAQRFNQSLAGIS